MIDIPNSFNQARAHIHGHTIIHQLQQRPNQYFSTGYNSFRYATPLLFLPPPASPSVASGVPENAAVSKRAFTPNTYSGLFGSTLRLTGNGIAPSDKGECSNEGSSGESEFHDLFMKVTE